ncbi:hypothetical protein Bca4012_092790 [Brassica carinata]
MEKMTNVAVVSGGGSPLCLSSLCGATIPCRSYNGAIGAVVCHAVRPAFTSDIHGRLGKNGEMVRRSSGNRSPKLIVEPAKYAEKPAKWANQRVASPRNIHQPR